MKIALLTEKYTPDIGGLAISTERLAKLLNVAGHEVRIFAPTPSTALRAGSSLPASEKQTLNFEGINVTRFGAHKRVDDTLVDWFELLVSEHQREPFDILQAYFLPQAGFVAAYAGKYLHIPSVVSARGNDLERAIFDPSRATHILYALQHANAVTTNTNDMIKKARALVPGLEVTLIPNSVDTEHFSPKPKNQGLTKALGLNNLPVIGFVGELRKKKGIHTLLNAYTQLRKKIPAALIILGDVRPGEDKNYFEEYKKSNPDSNIIVTGFVSPTDLPQYYALMDVMVMPSLRDGLPNALLEGMACEKAILATPVGGIKDVIQDGINGKLIPVRDVNHLTSAMEELVMKESLRSKLGVAGRETVIMDYQLKKELDANLNLYIKLKSDER